MRNTYKIVAGKPEEKRPLEKPGHKCGDATETYLKETECEVVHEITLACNWLLHHCMYCLQREMWDI
jgi:hypothetical protein